MGVSVYMSKLFEESVIKLVFYMALTFPFEGWELPHTNQAASMYKSIKATTN